MRLCGRKMQGSWNNGKPHYRCVNGLWEIRLGGLGLSGLAATSFPG
jgi:hypothetical protein